MSQEQNVAMARAMYEALNRDDLEGVFATTHEALEFRTSGVYPGLEPVYRGHAGFRRFWRDFRGAWDRLQLTVESISGHGARVVGLYTFEASGRDAIAVRRPGANVITYSDGLAVRIDSYGDWDEALEAVREQPVSRGDGELVRAALEAIGRGELETMLSITDPEVQFTSLITEADEAVYRGHDGVRRWFATVTATFEHFQTEPDEIRELGRGRVIARLTLRGTVNAVEVTQPMWQTVTLAAGKITGWRIFRTEAEALGALQGAGAGD